MGFENIQAFARTQDVFPHLTAISPFPVPELTGELGHQGQVVLMMLL